jgi:hypothetical protein
MKKIYGLMLLLGVISASFGQISTGAVTLSGTYTAKVDVSTTLVTLTLTGPSDRWFALAFNNSGMDSGDLVAFDGTNLTDRTLGGYGVVPSLDTKQDWTITAGGNTINGTIRTIVATRALNTGEIGDQVFSTTDTTIKLGWARAGSANYIFQGHNKDGGFTTGTFSGTLATENFATPGAIEVYPNPSKSGVFFVSKNNSISISKIKVFDTTAKLLKSVNASKTNQIENIDLSSLAKGLYFMELSNSIDKTVKKIVIE